MHVFIPMSLLIYHFIKPHEDISECPSVAVVQIMELLEKVVSDFGNHCLNLCLFCMSLYCCCNICL